MTDQDVGAFQAWGRRRHPRSWLAYLLVVAILLPGVVVLGGLFEDARLMLVFAAVLAILFPLEQRRKMRQIWRDSGVVGSHSLEVGEAGLVYWSPHGAARLDWRQIQGIERHSERAYFLIGPITAIILPLRAFSRPAEADAFLDESRRRHSAALARPLPPLPPLDVPEGGVGVRYELNEADLRAIQLYPLLRMRGFFVTMGLLVVVGAAMATVRWGLVWALALVAAEAAIFLALALALRRDHELLVADPSSTSPRWLVISPHGMVGRGVGAEEGQVSWDQAQRVDGSREHLFILWKQQTALGIPRRCFASEADADAFLARAREWLAASQPPAPGRKTRA